MLRKILDLIAFLLFICFQAATLHLIQRLKNIALTVMFCFPNSSSPDSAIRLFRTLLIFYFCSIGFSFSSKIPFKTFSGPSHNPLDPITTALISSTLSVNSEGSELNKDFPSLFKFLYLRFPIPLVCKNFPLIKLSAMNPPFLAIVSASSAVYMTWLPEVRTNVCGEFL